VLAVPLTTGIGVAVVRASDRGGRAGGTDAAPGTAPAPTGPTATDQAPAQPEADDAPTRQPVPAVPGGTSQPDAATAPQAPVAGPTPEHEAATEARWKRWRREKPVDDFGFSDLRDPDEKGTGSTRRPSR